MTRYLPLGAVATSTLRNAAAARYRGVPAKNELAAGRWTMASRDDGTAQETPDVAAGNATTFAATYQALTTLRHTDQPRRPVADARPGGGN